MRWCWGTRLVMAGAVLWLAFIVADLVIADRLWLWALAGALPPAAYLAVPVVLLALARLARPAWWRIVLLAGTALLFSAGHSGLNLAAIRHDPPPAGPDAIRVVSWNTEYWDQWDDPATFYRYLKALDADVYLLQEYLFFHGDQPVEVADLDRVRAEFPGYHISVASELLTLSRFPIAGERALDATPYMSTRDRPAPGTDFLAYWTTKVLRTDIQVGPRVVSFYNTHAYVPIDLQESPLRPGFYQFLRAQHNRRQASFRALLADLDRNANPAVVAGDFNASPAGGDLRRLSGRLTDASYAMADVYPGSWPDNRPLWRLDWVFTTSDVDVNDYRLLGAEGLSDHRAQRVLLSIPERTDR